MGKMHLREIVSRLYESFDTTVSRSNLTAATSHELESDWEEATRAFELLRNFTKEGFYKKNDEEKTTCSHSVDVEHFTDENYVRLCKTMYAWLADAAKACENQFSSIHKDCHTLSP